MSFSPLETRWKENGKKGNSIEKARNTWISSEFFCTATCNECLWVLNIGSRCQHWRLRVYKNESEWRSKWIGSLKLNSEMNESKSLSGIRTFVWPFNFKCLQNETHHRWLGVYSKCSRRSATLLEMSFECNKTQVDFDFNYENKCIYLKPLELRVLNVITNFFSAIINLVRQMDIFTFMNFFIKLIFYSFRQFCAIFIRSYRESIYKSHYILIENQKRFGIQFQFNLKLFSTYSKFQLILHLLLIIC